MDQPQIPNNPTRRRIAVAGDLDPETVARYFRRQPIRPSSLARIERALAELGMPRRPQPQEAATNGRA